MTSNLTAPGLGEEKLDSNEQVQSIKMTTEVTNERNIEVLVNTLTKKERLKFMSLKEEKFQYSLISAENGA